MPVKVAGLTGVTNVAAGWYTSLAVKSDGTVWAWGDNSQEELGGGTTSNSSSVPVKVPDLSGAIQVAGGYGFSLALKSDGTVWAWGYGANTGQPSAPILSPPGPGAGFERGSPDRRRHLPQPGPQIEPYRLGLGRKLYGQLGNGLIVNCPTASPVDGWCLLPAEVRGLSQATQVAAGYAPRSDAPRGP